MTDYYEPAAVAGITEINGVAAEGAVISPEPGETEAVISSITGYAWASHSIDYHESGDRKYSWDFATLAYDLLFFRNHEPNVETPRFRKPWGSGFIYPDALYAFRRWRRAVGYGEVNADKRPVRASSTPGELLAGGATISLPVGAYWLIVVAYHSARYAGYPNHLLYHELMVPAPPNWYGQLASNTFGNHKHDGATQWLWTMTPNGVPITDDGDYFLQPPNQGYKIPEATRLGLAWQPVVTSDRDALIVADGSGRPALYTSGSQKNRWLIRAEEITAFRVNDVKWRSAA